MSDLRYQIADAITKMHTTGGVSVEKHYPQADAAIWLIVRWIRARAKEKRELAAKYRAVEEDYRAHRMASQAAALDEAATELLDFFSTSDEACVSATN